MTSQNIKSEKVEPEAFNQTDTEDDEEDPIVKEIDVFMAKSLANKIYILQVCLVLFEFNLIYLFT